MKRGRRSADELSTIVIDASRRLPPRPPAELTDAQAMIWRDAAASMSGDWLTKAAYPILIAYCRHACRARLLEMQIAKFEPEWVSHDGGLDRLDKMLSMAERETRAMTACARALRLTPQARIDAAKAGRIVNNMPQGPFPWDR